MITVTKQDNSVLFEFEDNQHYLQNGTIEVPFNSLILVEDESDMITFRKASTSDILFSAMYTEFSSLGNTKDAVVAELEDMLFAEGGGGSGSGVTPSEVEEIVESALTPYWTSGQTEQAIYGATSGLASYSSVTLEVRGATSGLAASSAVTQEINAAVSGKQDISAMTQYLTSAQTQSAITQSVSGKQDTLKFYSEVDSDYKAAILEVSESDKNYSMFLDTEDAIKITASGSEGNTEVAVGANSFGVVATDNTNETSFIVNQTAVTINGDAVATEQYVEDAISGKADSSDVTAEITAAVSGKQETLVSGTNIKTINNESLLGSGNITISGGGSVTIDPTLSSGSSNAVANSAITNAIDAKQDTLAFYTETNNANYNVGKIEVTDGLGNEGTVRVVKSVYQNGGEVYIDSYKDDGEGDYANTHIQVKPSEIQFDSAVLDGEGNEVTSSVSFTYASGLTVNGARVATVNDIPSGSSNVTEVTQAEYDALVSGQTVDPDTLYIISDAQEVNLSGYAQSSAVTAEITAAVSGKADSSAITYMQVTTNLTQSITSASTTTEYPSAKAVYDKGYLTSANFSYNPSTSALTITV